MVCVPCIVIPLLLWIWHKFLQPWVLKFWNPWGSKLITDSSSPPSGVSADDTHYQYIHQMVTDHPVVLFSKSSCSFCKMARDVLDKTEVNYTIEEIGSRDDCDNIQDMFEKMTGQRTVPRVFIGQKCIGGGSETWTLHNQNKLLVMMKEAGATFANKKTD